MVRAKRSLENPIVIPESGDFWQSAATFNPSVVEDKAGAVHMFFRAVGNGSEMSSIGHAVSGDGVRFGAAKQLIAPTEPWEKLGCEDPRVTRFEGCYYIFYTAVSEFSADGIKVAVALTKDLKTIDEKHLVTPFNAKAMALFPERVGGKIAALITVNTDRPPARICLALFDTVDQIWSE